MSEPEPSAKKPIMIVIGGLSGSGKTTLGEDLRSVMPGAVLLDSDTMRKKMFGVSSLTPLPEDAYSAENTRLFIAYIRLETAQLLRQGKTVIVTGTFLEKSTRLEQRQLAHENGADFYSLYLDAPLSVLHQRVAERRHSESDATTEVLAKQSYKSPQLTELDWPVIRSDQTRQEVLQASVKSLIRQKKQKAPWRKVHRHGKGM